MSYGGNFNAKRDNNLTDQYEEWHSNDHRNRSVTYRSDHAGRNDYKQPNGNQGFNKGISSNYASKAKAVHDDDDTSTLFGHKPAADLYDSTSHRKNAARTLSKSPPYASAAANQYAGSPKGAVRHNSASVFGLESQIDRGPSLRSSRSEGHRASSRPILTHSTTGEYRSTRKSRNNHGTTDIHQFLDSSDQEEMMDGMAYGVNMSDVQDPYPSTKSNVAAKGVYSTAGEPLANMNVLTTTKKEPPQITSPEGELAEGLAYGISVADLQDPYPSMRNSTTAQGGYSSNPTSSAGKSLAHSNISHKTLPPTKEATPIMPPNAATEPKLPRPRVSRRYLRYTQKEWQPDLAFARRVENARCTPGEYDKHVLKCPSCHSLLKVPKLAVLMQCPNCATINPTTSTSSLEKS